MSVRRSFCRVPARNLPPGRDKSLPYDILIFPKGHPYA